jgi:hypothetical protein
VRRYIDIITEAIRPDDFDPAPRVSTRTQDEPNFDFLNTIRQDQPLARTTSREVLPGKKAKRKRARQMQVDPETSATAAAHLANLPQADDEISDAEARLRAGVEDDDVTDVAGAEPIPPTTENLPAVIHREVALTGGRVDPEWHQVKHLPGYLQSGIRALGRQVFRQFTETPIEDIQVITTLGNINPERDVVGMMDWIRRNGARDDAANMDFGQTMPGYTADVQLWRTKDYSFLLVHDFGGYYIYGWQGGRGVHLAPPREVRRLR